MKRILTISALLVLLAPWAKAQTEVQTLLTAVQKQYEQAYRSHFEVKLWQGNNNTSTQSGEVRVDPTQQSIYVDYAGNKTIISDDQSVLINSLHKMVYVQKVEDDQPLSNGFNAMSIIDSLLQTNPNALSLVKLGTGHYRVDQRQVSPEIAEAQYTIRNRALVEATFFYEDVEGLPFDRVSIKYTQLGFAANWPSKDFPITKVVQRKGKKYALTTAYHDYQLIDIDDHKKAF